MILLREKCTSSRSRDHHGLFFMNKQRMCVWARKGLADPVPDSSIYPTWPTTIRHARAPRAWPYGGVVQHGPEGDGDQLPIWPIDIVASVRPKEDDWSIYYIESPKESMHYIDDG